jgi:hypothetical protein
MDSLRHHHPALTERHPFRVREGILILLLAVLATATLSAAGSPYAAWEKTLTSPAQAPFRGIDPFRATYRFGWEGVGAGGAEVEVTKGHDASGNPNPLRRRITGKGGPNSLIRKLWNYHADYVGEAGVDGQGPSWFHMDEEVAKGDYLSDAYFSANANASSGSFVACHRFPWEKKPWTSAQLPGVRDLFAAMLLVRSQPLRDGDRLRLTVFPDRSPYLVDLTVEGRDTLVMFGRKIRAIRFSVRIQSIETQGPAIGRLAPHKKFRSGRVWMSDDDRRLPLRAEVDVFIGSVFAELVKITPPL